MQTHYHANPSYSISNPILNTQITFIVSVKGRLQDIIWRYETSEDGIRENSWGNEKREHWDLQNGANEHDLARAFKILALGNPSDFKELYNTLKEHDETVFPIIEEVLKEIQKLFNFN